LDWTITLTNSEARNNTCGLTDASVFSEGCSQKMQRYTLFFNFRSKGQKSWLKKKLFTPAAK
jgi:hypothetical protein